MERRLGIIIVVVLMVIFGVCLYICREAENTGKELREGYEGAEVAHHRLTKQSEEKEVKKIKQGENKNVEK